jgi:tRNA A37 threonylcarbamoyladenosine dehydratase
MTINESFWHCSKNSMGDIPTQFGGLARLYGREAFQKLQQSHVMIIGIGGVGSWAVEVLARSGVGKLTLVDLDDVCESNINRQIHAVYGQVGKAKVDVMRERILQIAPSCVVDARQEYFTESSAEKILELAPDAVFDAIDSLRHKVLLLKLCRRRKIPLIVSGGAGGRVDPTRVKIEDLARTKNDKLLQKLRKELRMKHGFTRDLKKKFGVACVYSDELAREPFEDAMDCSVDEGKSRKLDCESGFGTAGYVTGVFGLTAASWIVERLLRN